MDPLVRNEKLDVQKQQPCFSDWV